MRRSVSVVKALLPIDQEECPTAVFVTIGPRK